MGEIKYNGRTYSGLIQANGFFVDPNNVIVPTTQFRSSLTYVATEDCVVSLYLVGAANDSTQIRIDGEWVQSYWQGQMMTTGSAPIFVKKGQTLTVVGVVSEYDSSYIVHGVQQGSPITFLSEYASACYDTNEREVGCWTDGKPLYQKTLVYTHLNLDASGTGIDISALNVDMCCCVYAGSYYIVSNVKRAFDFVEYQEPNYLYLYPTINRSDTTVYVTLQYTKTTDTAGSGKLTPTGFETHHYSTNEQIVGTWIDGKPLYEVTVEVDNPTSNVYNNTRYIDIPYASNEIDFGRLISCEVYDATDSRWYDLPYQRIMSSENINIQAMVLSNGSYQVTAHWNSSLNYSITKIRYTIQFTKTTD